MSSSKAERIIGILRKLYPQRVRGDVASTDRRKAFHVLVTTIISQRNRDEVTEEVSERLLRKAGTPVKIVGLGKMRIEKEIRSANFYKTKAGHILLSAKMILLDFGGRVPSSREDLMRLPGVGGKTADIILLSSFGQSVIPVDTHVQVVSQRLGWTKEKEPEKIRKDLHRIFPPRTRGFVNILLVEFGKETCRMHMPRCYSCPISGLCPYPNKTKARF
jgi:endonuclease III